MAITHNERLTVPFGNGTNDPVALGNGIVAIGVTVQNTSGSYLYLLAVGDAAAKADPANRSIPIAPNNRHVVAAGYSLNDWGLLSESDSNSTAFVIGS